ncbi:hypothetical protein RRG08_007853 [Elysia crispata]|uniref:Secreted protein n=1 Tax=Elysia crispata TaxID=231223 RepID=A0AAE0XW44_9GAST|nr:hypothetical protein RRG08_007853 [Elysia crispata]
MIIPCPWACLALQAWTLTLPPSRGVRGCSLCDQDRTAAQGSCYLYRFILGWSILLKNSRDKVKETSDSQMISGAEVMKTTDIVCSTNGWKTRAVQGFSRLSRFPRASMLEVRFQLRHRQQPEPEQRTTLQSQSCNPPINSNEVAR